MMTVSPFGCVSTHLVAFLAIWGSAITISCQEDGHAGQGDRIRPVDPVQFLLNEGHPVNKVAPLPYDINLNCELIFGIKITPFVPQKQDEDDYEDYAEENNTEPAREAGEVIFTLEHPNFEDGQLEILVGVDDHGNGFKKETVCFKHCANITDNKGFTLSAKTDLKSTVDIKLVLEKGNHECQKDRIVVEYNTTTIEKVVIDERYKTEAETYKSQATIFGSLLAVCLVVCIVLVAIVCRMCRERRNINALKYTNEKEYGGQGDREMASLNEESETPPPASRDMKRGLSPQVAEGFKEKTPGDKVFETLGDNKEQQNAWFNRICNRFSFLIFATFVSFLLTFIFAILTALALL